jgi:hypothetical protein
MTTDSGKASFAILLVKTKGKYRLTGKEKGIRYTLHRLSEESAK